MAGNLSEKKTAVAKTRIRVLIIEDNPADAELACGELRKAGFEIIADVVQTREEFLEKLRSQPYDIVLADYRLPSWSGMDALEMLWKEGKEIPFILLSGTVGEETAVEFIKDGATDYVLKDRLTRLPQVVGRALKEKAQKDERKRAEEALRGSEERYRLLFETNPLPMWIYDRETLSFLAVNDSAIACYEYSREEFLGMTIKDIRPSEDTPDLLEDISKTPSGLSETRVWRHRKKDGSIIDVEITSHSLPFGKGQTRLVVANDVTERKEAEQHLARMEGRYRGLLEAAPDAMVVVNQSGEIVLLNVQAEKQFGYRRDELVGQKVKNIIPEGFAERLIADGTRSAAEALAQQIGMGIELSGRRKDGSEFPIEIMLSPLESADGILVTAAIRNVTERKKLAQQLLQSQKMEAIGQLAGGVAHDFNNLLTVISGFGELALDSLAPDSPSRDHLEEVLRASGRAASLTRQLLAFSRRQTLQPKVLDLNEVVVNVEKMLQRLIGENIELVAVPAPDLGRVKADPGQIEQIIMNLALNARDAMPQGGKLTIETANVELDAAYSRVHSEARPGPHVMLAVTDTGSGMDKETQARIFEPFFTTKEKGKGTGLGLSTVYGIVKQSDGNIFVYSEPGRGTTFKVYFPQVQEDAAVVQSSGAARPLKGTETILVVEDEEPIRRLVCAVLESNGYKVLIAKRGEEALTLSEGHQGPINIMLTDLVMPGMSGHELAGRLAPKRPEMRMLYMSGYTDDAVVRSGLLESSVAFIQKPFTPDALARKVREVLDASRSPK